MNEFERGLDPKEIKLVERDARLLARALDIPVGIGHDLSITIRNVTFGHFLNLDPASMADLVDYFSDAEQHMHLDGRATTSPSLHEFEGNWNHQSSGPAEKPEFIKTIEPPTGIRKLARKVLLG